MIQAPLLSAIDGIRHGFFTRQGGNSSGVYTSLNTGIGSDDDKQVVLGNRRVVAGQLGASHLITPYQIHSADAIVVTDPWDWQNPPKADGVVTLQKDIAVAVNAADCTPVLFASRDGCVVGAAHAGWKGAFGGVLEATVAQMETLGVKRGDICAAIGPTISKANYEVGPEFQARFVEARTDNAEFFAPSARAEHFMFDLPGYVAFRLDGLGLAGFHDVALCTYANEDRFFSYRRMTHRSEPDYGRQMAAIMVAS